MKSIRWNFETRKLLYIALLNRFGPWSDWTEGLTSPAASEFFDEFARVHDATNGSAVRLQVVYATEPMKGAGEKLRRNYYGNKVAAYEARFLTSKEAFGYDIYSPLDLDGMMTGFYTGLAHGADMLPCLEDMADKSFTKKDMLVNVNDKNRLVVACMGLLRLVPVLMLKHRDKHMPKPGEDYLIDHPTSYARLLEVLRETQRELERGAEQAAATYRLAGVDFE